MMFLLFLDPKGTIPIKLFDSVVTLYRENKASGGSSAYSGVILPHFTLLKKGIG